MGLVHSGAGLLTTSKMSSLQQPQIPNCQKPNSTTHYLISWITVHVCSFVWSVFSFKLRALVGRQWDTVTRDEDVWKDPVKVYSTELSGFDELIFAIGSSISTFSSRWIPAVLAFPPLIEVINVYGNSSNLPQRRCQAGQCLTDPLREAIMV